MGRLGLLIAVDPGNTSGVAFFHFGKLAQAGVHDGNTLSLWGYGGELAIEIPRIYPGGKGKGDPNDILNLAVMAGKILGTHDNQDAVTRYAPQAWKAQVDPDIMCTRVLGFLSEAERGYIAILPESIRHNAIDAVGIGLFHLKRMGRGGR